MTFGGLPAPQLEVPYEVTVKDRKDVFHAITVMKVRECVCVCVCACVCVREREREREREYLYIWETDIAHGAHILMLSYVSIYRV